MPADSTTWIFVALEALAVACLMHLWRRPTLLRKKLLWSLIIPLPLVGPLAYGAFFDGPPPPHDSTTSPPEPSEGVG